MALTQHTAPEQQLAIRQQRLRVARGVCWIIAVSLLGISTLTLLDTLIDLPGWVRGLGVAVGLTGFALLVWFFVVQPVQTLRIRDLRAIAPSEVRGNIKAATAATLLLLVSLLTSMLVPNFKEHIRRVAVPWSRPAQAQFRIIVTSNDPVVRSGDSVTLSAYVEKTDSAAALPETANVICRDADGSEATLVMQGDPSGAFFATEPTVTRDFKYRVEVGGVSSEWFAVTAILAAEPTLQSVLEIVPPRYAERAVAKQVLMGFVPFSSFQYGTVHLQLNFTRPAAKAFLEWRSDHEGPTVVTRVDLTEDHLSGTAQLELMRSGSLRLVTVAERLGKSLSSSISVPVEVKSDQAPHFERIRGISSRVLAVRPNQPLLVELSASDDIAIADVVVEYVVGQDDSRFDTLPVPLSGAGTAQVHGQLQFELPGKLRENETVRYRLRVADTRRLPDGSVKPHEIFYPSHGWATATVNANALPIEQQEILGQRDMLKEGLSRAGQCLQALIEQIQMLRNDTRSDFQLHHKVRLDQARELQQNTLLALEDLVAASRLTPELRALATRIQNRAIQPCQEAGGLLRKANIEVLIMKGTVLTTVENHFKSAAFEIDQLMRRNDQFAAARIDCLALETLLADYRDLAARSVREIPPADLPIVHKQLTSRFATILADSEPLRAAVAEVRNNFLSKMSHNAANLLTQLQTLETAIQKSEDLVRASVLEEIAAEQKLLSARAEQQLFRMELAVRLTGLNTPKAEEFQRLVNLISAGKIIEGLTEQQRLFEALEVAASSFEKWAAEREDVKNECHQYGLWQEDLRTRFRTATVGQDEQFPKLPTSTQQRFRQEQAALQASFAASVIPHSDELIKARAEARNNLAAVAMCLEGKGTNGDLSMKQVAESLQRLGDKIPSIATRLAKTRVEFGLIQKEQEAIQKSLEKVLSEEAATAGTPADQSAAFAKKIEPLLARQQKQLTRIIALDLPGVVSQRGRVQNALLAASSDLSARLRQDIGASQGWVKREFERLRALLEESPPLDEKVEGFVRRLEAIHNTLEATAQKPPSPEQAAVIATQFTAIQSVYRQLTQMNSAVMPGSAALKYEAQEALRTVDAACRELGSLEEIQRRLLMATQTMRGLAARFQGCESERERVQRLSWCRHNAYKALNRGNSASSDETRGQLVREAEELVYTRVGPTGQQLKQRALDLYEKLKYKNEADNDLGLQKSLVKTLDELAAMMADDADLSRPKETSPPLAVRREADRFLPSRELASALRALSVEQQKLREHLNRLPAEVARRSQASQSNPFLALESDQRKLASDLADFRRQFADSSEQRAVEIATKSSQAALQTADLLANGLANDARTASRIATESLRELVQLGAGRAWHSTVANLAKRQEALQALFTERLNLPGPRVAQQLARMRELGHQADELAQALQSYESEQTGTKLVPSGLVEVVPSLATAAKFLREAAEKATLGQPGEAKKLRLAAQKNLQGSSEQLRLLAPAPPGEANSDAQAVGEAVLRVQSRMRRLDLELEGKKAWSPSPAIAEITDALTRLLKLRLPDDVLMTEK